MALFKLTDITFNKESRGPLNALETSEGLGLDTNILKYPSDLGAVDKGHYMIIYINEQVNTKWSDAAGRGFDDSNTPTIERARAAISQAVGPTNLGQKVGAILNSGQNLLDAAFATDIGQALSKGSNQAKNSLGEATKNSVLGSNSSVQNAANWVSNQANKVASGVSSVNTTFQAGSFLRKVRRTKKAIALYMPDTLNFVYNQSYNTNFEVFNTLGKVGTGIAAGASLADAIKGEFASTTPLNTASFGLELLKGKGGLAGNLAKIGMAQLGVASNPGLEVIYGSPSFRTFRFDFLFYPRSRKEGEDVQNIINTFKFHQAPEFASQTGGKFLIPPSEFDIGFYYNGKVNGNIPKISTCVLTSIDIDYAPNGFSAYEVPGDLTPSVGGTGMPVAIRMSLNFTETQVVTKEYLQWSEKGYIETDEQKRKQAEFAKSFDGWNEWGE